MTENQRTPKRVQMSRQRPWRADHPDAVIVDRRTRWGNRFLVGKPFERDECVRLFRSVVLTGKAATELDGIKVEFAVHGAPTVAEVRERLAGRDLACWCPLDQPCHADVLLEIANGDA